MSSNNQLIIIKPKRHENSLFQIHENHCVDNEFKPTKKTLLKKVKTLEKASEFCYEYMQNHLVEYGVFIHPSCWKSKLKKSVSKKGRSSNKKIRG